MRKEYIKIKKVYGYHQINILVTEENFDLWMAILKEDKPAKLTKKGGEY